MGSPPEVDYSIGHRRYLSQPRLLGLDMDVRGIMDNDYPMLGMPVPPMAKGPPLCYSTQGGVEFRLRSKLLSISKQLLNSRVSNRSSSDCYSGVGGLKSENRMGLNILLPSTKYARRMRGRVTIDLKRCCWLAFYCTHQHFRPASTG